MASKFHKHVNRSKQGARHPAPRALASNDGKPVIVQSQPDDDRYAPHDVRMAVLKRDNFKCRYCGTTVTNETANMDHVVPYKVNGQTAPRNLVTACRPCNKAKGNKVWKPRPLDKGKPAEREPTEREAPTTAPRQVQR